MKKCPKCGLFHGDESQFCESCGSYLGHAKQRTTEKIAGFLKGSLGRAQEYSPGRSSPSSSPAREKDEKYGKIFITPDETVQAMIGVSSAQSFMSGAGFKNGAAILTDKRLYYFGRSFSNVGGSINTATEEGIISVDEITFTRFVHGSPLSYLIAAIIFFLPGLMLFKNSFGSMDSVAAGFGMIGLILAAFGILLFIAYFIGKSTVLEISFPGGKYCFDARWHSMALMRDFQRQIHMAKDRLKNSGSDESGAEEVERQS